MSKGYYFAQASKRGVKNQIENRISDAVYSPANIAEMIRLTGIQRVPTVERISSYARQMELGVTAKQLGIKVTFQEQANLYYIRSSNIQKLVDGLRIPIRMETLAKAAYDLGYCRR